MRLVVFPTSVRTVLFVGALVTGSPAIAEASHTRVERDGTGVTLSLYGAECDDNPQECPIADLGCPARGEFKASVYGLKAQEAGQWLASGGKAYLAVGAEQIPLWTRRIENSEMSGDWDASFFQLGEAEKVWRAVAKPGSLSLSVGARTVTFPRTVATLDAFRALLEGCAPL